jgi:hypothetical protein
LHILVDPTKASMDGRAGQMRLFQEALQNILPQLVSEDFFFGMAHFLIAIFPN